MKTDEVKKFLKDEVENLVSKMIDNFSVDVTEDEGFYKVKISVEEEAAVVIGRFGETIKALQRIIEVMSYKKFGEKINLLLDVNEFRENQQKRLEDKAKEWAEQVLEEDRPVSIRNLSSYERKIVHEFVSKNFSELTTESIGEGRGRRLIIKKK